ncbi:MAG: WYL domain-containing protein [Ignavibacteriales bacterium]
MANDGGAEGRKVRWGVQKRLEFLDFRLLWEGGFRREALTQKFGISPQQASTDIGDYQRMVPGNCVYDPVAKAYVRGESFEPRFSASAADRFLLQLVAIESGWLSREETWFETPPPVEVVPLRRKPTNAHHLMAVLDAIRLGQEVEVFYQALTGTPDHWRWIAPHALFFSAGRWYARAWSREPNAFRDFNLHRIADVRDARPSPVNASLDLQWAHQIDLILEPNPRLDEARRQAIASEYEMVDGKLTLFTRLSLAFYLMSEHNLDVPDENNLSPLKQQLVLTNLDSVVRARQVTEELAKQSLARLQIS